jgi:CPA1 family monovalent cation:H+ antiporter
MGSIGREYAVSDKTQDYLQKFWSLIDEVLNALLFLLIGFAFATVALRWTYIGAATFAIPFSVAVRMLRITITALPLHLRSPRKLAAMTLLALCAAASPSRWPCRQAIIATPC